MKKLLAFSLLVTVVSLSSLAFGQGSTPSDPAAVAAITQLENDAVKADLSGDASFYQNYLADDWTGGTSRGTWDTKSSLMADIRGQHYARTVLSTDTFLRQNGAWKQIAGHSSQAAK